MTGLGADVERRADDTEPEDRTDSQGGDQCIESGVDVVGALAESSVVEDHQAAAHQHVAADAEDVGYQRTVRGEVAERLVAHAQGSADDPHHDGADHHDPRQRRCHLESAQAVDGRTERHQRDDHEGRLVDRAEEAQRVQAQPGEADDEVDAERERVPREPALMSNVHTVL